MSTEPSTESLFNESELQRLKEEIEGYLPQTWPIAGHVENTTSLPSQALVPSELLHLGERLISVLESMRQYSIAPAALPPAPVSIADISHKLLLTLLEAAALTNLSRARLRQAIGQGSLKAKKLGRGWRIKRADLNAYVAKL
jgi:excisionase family DNA binding protein